jgi:tetratricopeptide (TPR) repeat protein
MKPTVFVSYSHKDEKLKDLLRPHLGVLEQQDRITIWDDRKIDPGGKWFAEIKEIMAQAAVSVCLISANYLSSDYCVKEEIPYLLERREKDGMVLIPVLLRPCAWKAVSWLKESQMIPRDGKSVSRDFKDDPDEVFAYVAEYIFDIIDNPGYIISELAPIWSPPEKISIDRMPMTGAKLFGRQKELSFLDKAWESENTHIVSFVAWGGVGKSTLINKWLEQLAADNYRGARKVFAWSFFSQGTGERVTSADLFIAKALDWFGDPDPNTGSPWDKGARLAELIRGEKTLLLLDGLEPLQSSHDYEQGKVKDPAMATLLNELARRNPGLCVITTRETVADLESYKESSCQKDLMKISDEAGRALLRISGVQGNDAELEATTREFGNHALAIILLGKYLRDIPGHCISYTSEIPDLDIPEKEGRHPRRMIAAFEQRYGKGPEVEVLRMLGLFNWPADPGEIAALKAAPPIPNLTEHIQVLSEADWLRLLQKLRQDRLIAPESRHQPDFLDAHPIVREHFGQQLRETYPEAWKEAHSRLYEYYKKKAKEYPETIEEMTLLYAAITHGCKAGRYQEAINDVYKHRIQRGNIFFNMKKLGAYGSDLAIISGFFVTQWNQPVNELEEIDKGLILSNAGFALRALGRVKEAVQPFQAARDYARGDLINSANATLNLSELYLCIGDLASALDYALQSVKFSDKISIALYEHLRIFSRAYLGDTLHQTWDMPKAKAHFRIAEQIQRKLEPAHQFLYSVPGFQYCDLLLSMGKYKDVRRRATKAIEIAKKVEWPLETALDHLSLGRSYLLQAQQEETSDFTLASNYLNNAVEYLRKAETQHYLPRGYLARAEMYRICGELKQSRHDLDEAMNIAERGEMGLYQADCHMEYARLFLAMGDKKMALEHLAIAKEMIRRLEYHRRDSEVEELEAIL